MIASILFGPKVERLKLDRVKYYNINACSLRVIKKILSVIISCTKYLVYM